MQADLDSACSGQGRVLIVQGPAGIGKSRLLSEAGRHAAAAGMDTLWAQGNTGEHGVAFGTALQLFGAHAPVLDGQDVVSGGGAAGVDALFGLTGQLAAREPLLLVVDDAHWADSKTLRFLLYLVHRIGELPVALALSMRSGEPGTDPKAVASLVAHAHSRVLRPMPLSEAAVHEIVTRAVPEGDDALCAGCFATTRGNPFLLHELVREIRAVPQDLPAPSGLGALAPRSVAVYMLAHIERVTEAGPGLARAIAVLGDGHELRAIAELAELSSGEACAAADALEKAGILEAGRGLGFGHPLVRTAIYQDVSRHTRAQMHLRAAQMLRDDGQPPERLAAHLLASPPTGSDWVVEALTAAGSEALHRGDPESAATRLRRALEEPPSASVRASVLVQLARAEARTGGNAPESLAAALRLSQDPCGRAEILHELGEVQLARARCNDATEAFEHGLAELEGSGGANVTALRARLSAGSVVAGHVLASSHPAGNGRLQHLQSPAAHACPGVRRTALAVLALGFALGSRTRERATEHARQALNADSADETAEGLCLYPAAAALTFAEELEEAERALSAALGRARERGSAHGVAWTLAFRAEVQYRLGCVDGAIADARGAIEHGGHAGRPTADAVLAMALMERGELDLADSFLKSFEDVEDVEDSKACAPYASYLEARARRHFLRGEHRAAVDDLKACGKLLAGAGVTNPSVMLWRSEAAMATARLGERSGAISLADEELDLAREFGGARARGVALRRRALVDENPSSIVMLQEAAESLEGSPARLERARTLLELGRALKRAGRSSAARDPLRRALDDSHRCGVTLLAERAADELVEAGGRPRRPQLTGHEALTPSEWRVTHLAKGGMTNREIAAALFVTMKTVEWHLHNAYRKLGVNSREELPALLPEDGEQ